MSANAEPTAVPAQPPSASALNVATCRAVAAHDPRAGIDGPDALAELFLDDAGRASLLSPAIVKAILEKLQAVSPGGYEFFHTRTVYLDGVMECALRDGFPQIVNLGAGYDTRANRFRDRLGAARVFELDLPATQQRKRQRLAAAGVACPPQLAYVPIDFTRDNLSDVLLVAGYRPELPALFLWEGVTYYLTAAAVEETLRFVHQAPAGSLLAFDYMIAADELPGRYGAVESRAAMQALYTGEPLHFDFSPAALPQFLAARGFEALEHLGVQDMEARFLTLADGTLAGRVLDLFGLVLARVCP